MTLPAPLAQLDWTPEPLSCEDCQVTATRRIRLSCGCGALYCVAHAMRYAAAVPLGLLVCRTHRRTTRIAFHESLHQ